MAGGLGTVVGTTGMVLGKQAMHADPQRLSHEASYNCARTQ